MESITSEINQTFTADYDNKQLLLLQKLIALQKHNNYLSNEQISTLSQQLAVSPADVQGVASFYHFLHTTPRGMYDIQISDNITDRFQGNLDIADQLRQASDTDGQSSVSLTSCIGMSDQGPAMLVNGRTIPRLDSQRVDLICNLIAHRTPLSDWPAELFAVDDNIYRRDLLLSTHFENGSALKSLLNKQPEELLNELEQSGLRGRGGAGFPTATKWRFCRQADADQRYVICNADEGEPGTFKDRVLLNSFADNLFEGMTLCAGLINASQGFVYLRYEYQYLLPRLQGVLQKRRESNLLGQNILGIAGFDFDIDIHLGAGAYICGEESALIESLEGQRGIPRIRPPFPVTNGYRDKPTVVNNVETFMAAARIAEQGANWFRQKGTQESAGTKLLSISGDCERPGIYEYPFGTTISEILDDCGASDTQAVQIAGAAGNLFATDEFSRSIAFEDVPTAGSFMILNQDRDLLAMITNFSEFFVNESCGFCTPCRVGTSLLKDLVSKLTNGHATNYDLDEIRSIGNLMKTSSHCGLGATAPNALLDLLAKFPDLIQQKLAHTSYEPAFDLDAALQEARDISGRDDAGAHIANDQGSGT